MVLGHRLLEHILHALAASPSVPVLVVDIAEVVDMELDPIPTLLQLNFGPLERLTRFHLVVAFLNAISWTKSG